MEARVIERIDAVAEKYIKLRDFKETVVAEGKVKVAKIDAIMDKLELEIMTFLNNTGQESAKTALGTVFKKTTTKVKVADWDITLPFIMKEELYNMLYRNVSKEAVEQYIEANDSVPPGISVTREISIGVNRPKTR